MSDFDRHPEDDAFRDFMADVDRHVSRLLIAVVVLALLSVTAAAMGAGLA